MDVPTRLASFLPSILSVPPAQCLCVRGCRGSREKGFSLCCPAPSGRGGGSHPTICGHPHMPPRLSLCGRGARDHRLPYSRIAGGNCHPGPLPRPVGPGSLGSSEESDDQKQLGRNKRHQKKCGRYAGTRQRHSLPGMARVTLGKGQLAAMCTGGRPPHP